MGKDDDNPISPAQRLQDAPRCHAKAKRSGERCKCPAVTGWRVCRVHGAGGGAPRGKAHGMWKHGGRSTEALEMQAYISELVREAREVQQTRRPEINGGR